MLFACSVWLFGLAVSSSRAEQARLCVRRTFYSLSLLRQRGFMRCEQQHTFAVKMMPFEQTLQASFLVHDLCLNRANAFLPLAFTVFRSCYSQDIANRASSLYLSQQRVRTRWHHLSSFNKLSFLPLALCELDNLHELCLNGNSSRARAALCDAEGCSERSPGNGIEFLPAEIAQLIQLRVLHLHSILQSSFCLLVSVNAKQSSR